MLLGEAAMQKLHAAKVAVFGLGGVGSYIVEALVRSGIGSLILVDGDVVDITNINRQLIATQSTIGQSKAQTAKQRAHAINPYCKVESHNIFYHPDNSSAIDLSSCTYIADAVDTVTAKILLAQTAHELNIPAISSMGAGNKLDPTRLEVADIFDTSVCPLARVMRRELKKRGIPSLKVVYSKEEPRIVSSGPPGSTAFVPSVAGLIIAGEIIRDIAQTRA